MASAVYTNDRQSFCSMMIDGFYVSLIPTMIAVFYVACSNCDRLFWTLVSFAFLGLPGVARPAPDLWLL